MHLRLVLCLSYVVTLEYGHDEEFFTRLWQLLSKLKKNHKMKPYNVTNHVLKYYVWKLSTNTSKGVNMEWGGVQSSVMRECKSSVLKSLFFFSTLWSYLCLNFLTFRCGACFILFIMLFSTEIRSGKRLLQLVSKGKYVKK